MFEPWMFNVGTLLIAGGTAFGGAKMALNGTRERVRQLADQFEDHAQNDDSVQRELLQRTAAMDAKLDLLIAGKIK